MIWLGTIRSGQDADGPAIGALFESVGLPRDVDWSSPGISGWWLVGEHYGAIVGAVQVCLSKPWAWLSEIVTAPWERDGRLAGALYLMALDLADKHGCQAVMGMVAEDRDDTLAETLHRQKWSTLGRYELLMRRF